MPYAIFPRFGLNGPYSVSPSSVLNVLKLSFSGTIACGFEVSNGLKGVSSLFVVTVSNSNCGLGIFLFFKLLPGRGVGYVDGVWRNLVRS